ncbi:AAA family ATPase [Candidatus Berkelbacteria bacterium]|nr:AAA family ATPase [Candidatus Berkelbacteria bacterium]
MNSSIFVPFSPPKKLPGLNSDQKKVLEKLIRSLSGKTKKHVFLTGKRGVGKHTLIQALSTYSKALHRTKCFKLDSGAFITQLYEPTDVSQFFRETNTFARTHSRALIFIDEPELIFDSIDRIEARRLARWLRELNDAFDVRIVMLGSNTIYLNSFPLLISKFDFLHLNGFSDQETGNLLQAQGPEINSLTQKITSLTRRFFPQYGLPGGALELLQNASEIAEQCRETLNQRHLYEWISEVRGIPLAALMVDESTQLISLKQNLKKDIIGQNHVIESVCRTILRASVGLRPNNRPIASFLFLGPSGVGKTELAKRVAEQLFKSPDAFIRIDMSEFSESHTVQRLIGAPPGYIGYEEGGQLTNPVYREPYSLVLLDEIEKAHPKVFDIFLQLLDDGRLTDGKGQTVDFTHTIVVATSNIGLNEIITAAHDGTLSNHQTFLRDKLFPLLIRHFRPEFLNRFDGLQVFQPLQIQHLIEIGQRELKSVAKYLQDRHVTLHVQSETLVKIAHEAYEPTFGARPMRRLIQDKIESPLAEKILRGELLPNSSITV